MALTSRIELNIGGRQTKAGDLGTASAPFSLSKLVELASGTGAGQADLLFADERTLAASANEDLDLAAVLADIYGATLTLAKVKFIAIVAAAGNTNNVQVTRPASNGVPLLMAAGDGKALQPGGFLAFYDPTGVTVTADSGDLINIANSGGSTSVTYQIVIIGTSA